MVQSFRLLTILESFFSCQSFHSLMTLFLIVNSFISMLWLISHLLFYLFNYLLKWLGFLQLPWCLTEVWNHAKIFNWNNFAKSWSLYGFTPSFQWRMISAKLLLLFPCTLAKHKWLEQSHDNLRMEVPCAVNIMIFTIFFRMNDSYFSL